MESYNYPPPQTGLSFDGLTLAAILFMAFIGLVLFNDLLGIGSEPGLAGDVVLQPEAVQTVKLPAVMALASAQPAAGPAGQGRATPKRQADPRTVAAPYKQYRITQGLHGASYGHAAIDIAAGEGAVIRSPINGKVAALYVDEYGNPTLVIENEVYQVTLMHGEYTVKQGDMVELGQPVGKESNLGYTLDMWGRPCAGRACGYHTHLNIFDKELGANVNPLDLIGK